MFPAALTFKSFKFKVSALVAVMVLIAAVAVCGISLLIAQSQVERMIARQEISALSGAAAFLDNDVRAKQDVLRSIAEEAQARRLGAGDMQALLDSHPLLRDEFSDVVAFDARGDRIATLKQRDARPLNVAARPYFQATLRRRDGVITAPFRSALSGRPVVSVTQPLIDARGDVHASLPAAWICFGPPSPRRSTRCAPANRAIYSSSPAMAPSSTTRARN
ncbi:hypothetical protein [Massilia sp. METH4]|uniref:PDC sensor domain-containing protein n=1 Tax=Massilia sp. METH4 TaxID=3123041 RepID=UPI0030D1753B